MKKDDSVILVGNGTSVLDSYHGQHIDLFDVVVRFNQFKIIGYEDHVGTKTNIWWATGADKEHRENKFDKVYFFSWCFDKEKDKAWQKFIKFQPNAIPIGLEPNLKELRELFPEYKSPSSGMMVIHMLLKEYNKVHLVGFDWWDREEHHYSDNAPRGTIHDPQIEHSYIKSLEKEGKVIFL
jgi:hypothetical protein